MQPNHQTQSNSILEQHIKALNTLQPVTYSLHSLVRSTILATHFEQFWTTCEQSGMHTQPWNTQTTFGITSYIFNPHASCYILLTHYSFDSIRNWYISNVQFDTARAKPCFPFQTDTLKLHLWTAFWNNKPMRNCSTFFTQFARSSLNSVILLNHFERLLNRLACTLNHGAETFSNNTIQLQTPYILFVSLYSLVRSMQRHIYYIWNTTMTAWLHIGHISRKDIFNLTNYGRENPLSWE